MGVGDSTTMGSERTPPVGAEKDGEGVGDGGSMPSMVVDIGQLPITV